jgi:N-acetylglucosamine malate deacetylase 2
VLVFDDTGVTGHPDHQAATRAAVLTAMTTGLPVLAWALPTAIADRLRAETGQPFSGQTPGRLDLCIRVDRTTQRRAALTHASQISPSAVLWRRLQLQGNCEHLRWLLPPSHV